MGISNIIKYDTKHKDDSIWTVEDDGVFERKKERKKERNPSHIASQYFYHFN